LIELYNELDEIEVSQLEKVKLYNRMQILTLLLTIKLIVGEKKPFGNYGIEHIKNTLAQVLKKLLDYLTDLVVML